MKNFILTIMTVLTMANSAVAMSPAIDADGWKDYTTVETPNIVINDETIIIAASAISDWDYFWGTTMNPANTGWNDFWFTCQDPSRSTLDCVGTIVAGTVAAAVAPLIIVGTTIVAASMMPVATTIAGIPITVITAGPAMSL